MSANSLISSALLAGCELVSVYRICEADDAESFHFPENATDGAREGFEVMKEVHGQQPFTCILPVNQINTDDFQQLVSNAKRSSDKPSSRMMHVENYQGNRRRAPHKAPKSLSIGGSTAQDQSQNDPLNPQRVKISVGSNTGGDVADPTINYMNLSETELPTSMCPSGFASMEVEGLLPGRIVYLNFIRKDAVNSEEARYVAFRRGPLRQFIKRIRSRNYGINPGDALKEKHTVVVSSDGDLGQVACLKDEALIEEERNLKIHSWKHNAARTQTEQGNDLGEVFPSMNRLEKTSTIDTSVPEEMTPNLVSAKRAFSLANRTFGLKFPDKKNKTLLYHLARFPDMWDESTLKKNVIPGYFANGQVDRSSKMVPDLKVMVKETLDRDIATWEWELVRSKMPEICKLLLKYGSIPDKTFLDWGFPADVNLSGEEVFRPDGMAQEHMHRAKLMDHPYQRDRRAKLALENIEKKNQKLAEKRDAHAAFLQANAVAESKILEVTDPSGQRNRNTMANVTLEQLFELNRADLKAFIIVRKFDGVLPRSYGLPGVKGKIEPSRVPNAPTLLRIAYDYRSMPVKLEEIPLASVDAEHSVASRAVPMVVPVHARGDFSHLRFTVNHEFVSLVKKSFDPFEATVLSRDDIEIDLSVVQTRSDLLHDILQQRLTNHIMQKCPKDARDHWVWHFTRNNIGRIASIMVLMQLAKPDLVPAKWDSNACLLQNPQKNTFLRIENRLKDLEGCYIIYDTERCRFIRSGKACNPGRTFDVRYNGDGGHRAKAATPNLARLDSKFYRSYPARAATAFSEGTRRGYFEELELYCGIGFYRGEPETLKPLVEVEDATKSIFSWDVDTMKHLEKANIQGTETLHNKQLVMVSYLAEVGFDVALSPEDNVSESPGHEAMLIHLLKKNLG